MADPSKKIKYSRSKTGTAIGTYTDIEGKYGKAGKEYIKYQSFKKIDKIGTGQVASTRTNWLVSKDTGEMVRKSMSYKRYKFSSTSQVENGFDALMQELKSQGVNTDEFKNDWESLSNKQKEEWFESYRESYQSGGYSSSATSEKTIINKKTVKQQAKIDDVNRWVKNAFNDVGKVY